MKKGFVILFVWIGFCGMAQPDSWLMARAGYGFLMAHRPTIPQLIDGHAQSLEFHYVSESNMSEDWHHIYGGPMQGVAAYVIDLGNADELGKMYGVFPYLSFPLVNSEKDGLYMQLGCGLTYVGRKFEFEENRTNFLVGSHLNVGIQLTAKYQRELGPLLIGTGLSFSHASNGTYQLPNLGSNVPSLDLYLGYRLHRASERISVREVSYEASEKVDTELNVSFGLRESNIVTREKHPVVEFRLDRLRDFSRKLSYIYGTDISFNRATYAELPEEETRTIESIIVGLKGGLAMRLGSSSLFIHTGVYVHDGYQQQGFMYHRFGGKKTFSDKYITSFTLKTHFAKADYFAFGVGMKL